MSSKPQERREDTYISRFWTNRKSVIDLARKHGFRMELDEKGTARTGREAYWIFTKGEAQARVLHNALDKDETPPQLLKWWGK